MPKSNKQNLDTPSLFGDVEPPPLRLRKAHEAIFVRPQEGSRLPLIVRKVFNLMLKHAQDVGIAHAEYEIPFRAMVKQLEYKSNDYDLLKNHLRELQRTQVEWDTLTEKGKRKWGVTSLVMYAKIEEGKIMYAFQEDIKTQLLNPSIYLDLDLNKQNAFRKPSSLAFYEMCGRYATNPTHLTARLHWKEWRDLLCREEAALYDEYKYFNARVLKPAIAEVNALSDIEVKQVAKKEGREQVDLQFEVRLKSANKSVLHEANGFNTELYKKLVALGVNATRARKALSEYDHSRIEATIDLVAKRARTPNLPRISSMSAYFLDALRNGYVPATEPKAERQALANAATIKKSKEDIRAAFETVRLHDAERLYLELDSDERARIMEEFIADLGKTDEGASTVKMVRTKGLRSKAAATLFFSWYGRRTWNEPTDAELLEFAIQRGLLSP